MNTTIKYPKIAPHFSEAPKGAWSQNSIKDHLYPLSFICLAHLELNVVSYLLIESFYIGMHLWCGRTVGRSVGRAYGNVINKICRMDGLPNFLSYGASRASGAPLLIRTDSSQVSFFLFKIRCRMLDI